MADILRQAVEPEEILFALKKGMLFKDVCYKILQQRVIDEAAQAKTVTVTPEEIQAEADRLRHELHLQKASDTLSWLAGQLVTVDDWEAGIRDRLLQQKLANALFGDDVERYFAEHRLDYDQVLLYRIRVPYEQLAQELFYEIEEDEVSFYTAANLYDVDERRRLQCGYEGKLYRWSLKPELAAVIFNAREREVIAPFQTEEGFELLMVGEFINAQLTDEIRQKIVNQLFTEWLTSEVNHLIHQSDFPTEP